MGVIKKLLIILTAMLLLSGCRQNVSRETTTATGGSSATTQGADATTTPIVERRISAKGRNYSIEEVEQGILRAFNTEFYYAGEYDAHLDRSLILNKTLEYDLVFVDDGYQAYVLLIVNNLEHPLSTEEEPKFKFGVAFSDQGMAEGFCTFGTTSEEAFENIVNSRGTVYLGKHTISIGEIPKPEHEQMSAEWVQAAESAIRLYMDKNDFHYEAEKNLTPGNYRVYIKGFSKGDTDSRIIFEHENGSLYEGVYYFVHDISQDSVADLNHVALVSEPDEDHMQWLDKVRENAALRMEYSVQ